IYFAALLVAGLLYPGYRHFSQVPSILGTSEAPFSEIYNVGMVATALIGLFGALRKLGSSLLLSLLTGASLGLFAVSVAMSGLFPLPNPLHHGFNLVLAGLLTPLFGSLALGNRSRTRMARRIVLAGFATSVVLLAINLGLGGVATARNIGLWLRTLSAVS